VEQATGNDAIVKSFAELWWSDRSIFFGQTWLGIPTWQHPFDAWVTQEIIVETRPERLVEAGALCGGSATMWAMLLEHMAQDGRVVAIDLQDNMEQARTIDVFRRRVDFVHGSTVDPAVVARVGAMVEGYRTMVILDSAHDTAHVAAEIEAYAPMVSAGCYLIVQDGVVNGHPLEPHHGPGPFEAVQDLLASDDRFEVDHTRERMLFTFNPSGFLRRR
jgi:cephalosporin hydroxylase